MEGDINQKQDNFSESQISWYEREKLSRREKINSIIIIFIGIGTLFFAVISMIINISNPFSDILKIGQAQLKAQEEQEKAQLLALQKTDTDGDGLIDYLEIYQYGTSPYLKDSDGDGLSDAEEITKGTNPNCPEGQQCFNNDKNRNSSDTSDVPSLVTEISANNKGKVAITPDFLRQVLIESGFDKEMIEETPDSDLLSLFQEYTKSNPEIASKYFDTSNGQEIKTSLPNPDVSKVDLSSLGVKSLEDLKNLSGNQIRTLMVQSGAPEDLLKTVSDEQLKELFLKQLEKKINIDTNSN